MKIHWVIFIIKSEAHPRLHFLTSKVLFCCSIHITYIRRQKDTFSENGLKGFSIWGSYELSPFFITQCWNIFLLKKARINVSVVIIYLWSRYIKPFGFFFKVKYAMFHGSKACTLTINEWFNIVNIEPTWKNY